MCFRVFCRDVAGQRAPPVRVPLHIVLFMLPLYLTISLSVISLLWPTPTGEGGGGRGGGGHWICFLLSY